MTVCLIAYALRLLLPAIVENRLDYKLDLSKLQDVAGFLGPIAAPLPLCGLIFMWLSRLDPASTPASAKASQ